MKTIQYLILTVLVSVVSSVAFAQTWLWAKDGGNTPDAVAWNLTVNTNNQIYFTGAFYNSIAFDTSNYAIGASSRQFVAEYTNDGNFSKVAWIRKGNSQSSTGLFGLNHDQSGSVFVNGDIAGTNVFDTLRTYNGNGGFLTKFSSDLGGLKIMYAGDLVYSTAFDSTNNIYVAGTITKPTAWVDTFTLHNPDPNPIFNPKMFLAKLDSNGRCQWAKQAYGGSSIIYSIKQSGGNIYLLGYTDSCVAFDTATLCISRRFVMMTDSNGNVKWVSAFGAPEHGYFNDIDVDASGNCYVAGGFRASTKLGSDSLIITPANAANNAFIAKFNTSGSIVWVKQFNSDSLIYLNHLKTDDEGNTYALGYYCKTALLGNDTVTATSFSEMLILRVNANGTYLGHKSVSGNFSEEDITQDNNGNAIVAGKFKNGTAHFDDITLTATGQYNFFLAKLEAITGNNSIAAIPQDNSLRIYANPNLGAFTIDVPEELRRTSAQARLSMYDNTGRIVKEEYVNIAGNRIAIDIGTVRKGIYSIILSSNERKYTGRVVVE